MWSGLWQMLLDLVCVALAAVVGIEERLDKALIMTAVAGLISGLLFLGESKAEREQFNLLSFPNTSLRIANSDDEGRRSSVLHVLWHCSPDDIPLPYAISRPETA